MQIKWYGTASLLLTTGQTKILIDPYSRVWNPELSPFPFDSIMDVDAVLTTHPHFDHFYHTKEVAEATKAPIYVCQRGFEIAKEQGFPLENLRECKVGESWMIGDIRVTVYQGKHCRFDVPLILHKHNDVIHRHMVRQANAVMAQNAAFSIGKKDIYNYYFEAEGKRILVIGSANLDLKEKNPTEMDLLVFPYQGRSKMKRYSLRIIEKIRPKALFLDHFDDAFPPISETMDCDGLIEELHRRMPNIAVVKPLEGQFYEV